jgi:hypothetical protein
MQFPNSKTMMMVMFNILKKLSALKLEQFTFKTHNISITDTWTLNIPAYNRLRQEKLNYKEQVYKKSVYNYRLEISERVKVSKHNSNDVLFHSDITKTQSVQCFVLQTVHVLTGTQTDQNTTQLIKGLVACYDCVSR